MREVEAMINEGIKKGYAIDRSNLDLTTSISFDKDILDLANGDTVILVTYELKSVRGKVVATHFRQFTNDTKGLQLATRFMMRLENFK